MQGKISRTQAQIEQLQRSLIWIYGHLELSDLMFVCVRACIHRYYTEGIGNGSL